MSSNLANHSDVRSMREEDLDRSNNIKDNACAYLLFSLSLCLILCSCTSPLLLFLAGMGILPQIFDAVNKVGNATWASASEDELGNLSGRHFGCEFSFDAPNINVSSQMLSCDIDGLPAHLLGFLVAAFFILIRLYYDCFYKLILGLQYMASLQAGQNLELSDVRMMPVSAYFKKPILEHKSCPCKPSNAFRSVGNRIEYLVHAIPGQTLRNTALLQMLTIEFYGSWHSVYLLVIVPVSFCLASLTLFPSYSISVMAFKNNDRLNTEERYRPCCLFYLVLEPALFFLAYGYYGLALLNPSYEVFPDAHPAVIGTFILIAGVTIFWSGQVIYVQQTMGFGSKFFSALSPVVGIYKIVKERARNNFPTLKYKHCNLVQSHE